MPVKRQGELLDLSRSSVDYTPRALAERDLQLMRRVDELHQGSQFAIEVCIGTLKQAAVPSAWTARAAGSTTC